MLLTLSMSVCICDVTEDFLFLSLSESALSKNGCDSFMRFLFSILSEIPQRDTHNNKYVYDISRIVVDGILVFERE